MAPYDLAVEPRVNGIGPTQSALNGSTGRYVRGVTAHVETRLEHLEAREDAAFTDSDT